MEQCSFDAMELIPSQFQTSSLRVLFEDGRWRTYADLTSDVEALAERLRAKRALAFCFCRTNVATVVNYLACLRAGHAIALLDAALHPSARLALIKHYQPELLLATGDLGETIVEYRDAGSHSAPHPDLAVLLSTSGTTGSPKLVRLSAGNILHNAESIRAALAIQPDDCAMGSLPFHYSYGLSVLNSHLRAGASLALTHDGMMSAGFWDVCREAECTSMAGVPYTYQLLRRLGLEALNVPKLTTLTQAGGKLAPELVSEFHALAERRRGRFFVMYGQTEATARIAVLPHAEVPARSGSAGLPIPGGAFQVQTKDGRVTVEPNVSGEVLYCGPNVMLGYATTRADLALGDEMRGRLPTGDLGHLDEDGYLYVSARLKREAKVAGHRINLDEVEGLLKMRGPTAAIAGPEKILIFCEWGSSALFGQALKELAERMRFSQHAFEFRRIPVLPVTSSGKVDYACLATE